MSLADDIVAHASRLPKCRPRPEIGFVPHRPNRPYVHKRKWKKLPVGVHHDPRCVTRPYHCRVFFNRKGKHLGFFETPERASIAHRLAKHWLQRGFDLEDIPVRLYDYYPDAVAG